MPNARRLMRQVREILRLKYAQGLPHRAIARACGVGLGTVSEYCRRAEQVGLTWPLPDDLDDAQLEARLFQRVHDLVGVPRPLPDMAWIHQELTRPGVTLQRLWLEFLEAHPDTYRDSQCCLHYHRWVRTPAPTMRQVHRAGERVFVDFSGQRPVIWNRTTGEAEPVELFVGVLGGRIPSCKGVVAFGATLRECEDALRSTFEDWVLLGIKLGHPLPILGEIDLNKEPTREPLDAT